MDISKMNKLRQNYSDLHKWNYKQNNYSSSINKKSSSSPACISLICFSICCFDSGSFVDVWMSIRKSK